MAAGLTAKTDARMAFRERPSCRPDTARAHSGEDAGDAVRAFFSLVAGRLHPGEISAESKYGRRKATGLATNVVRPSDASRSKQERVGPPSRLYAGTSTGRAA